MTFLNKTRTETFLCLCLKSKKTIDSLKLSIMKHFVSLFVWLFFCVVHGNASMTFVHPGAVNSKHDLDFVKAKIKAGEQPWKDAFNEMKSFATGGVSPLEYIDPRDNTQSNISKVEGRKAYANALCWYYTDDTAYAKQAIAVLNAWSTFKGITGIDDQKMLHAGWIGALFGPAAEIMRGYSKWDTADIRKVVAMFKRAYYPLLNTASTWNGNVDLTQIDALMNIAVFCEDETEFKIGLNRLKARNPAYFYLESDNTISRSISGSNYPYSWGFWNASTNITDLPTLWEDGLTQESCRDNNHHSQFALASALHAAEVAWNQGIDVYHDNMQRYTTAMELMAVQCLTGTMQGTCKNNVTASDLFDTWEVGYNHYHNRLGIKLPKTEQLIKERLRTEGMSEWNIFFESLTHSDIVDSIAIDSPTVILTQPRSIALAKGASTTLSVSVFGRRPLSYQWKKNDVIIPNEKSETLALTNISNSDSANYQVVITNTHDTIESSIAHVSIVEKKPYKSSAIAIPGRLETENFDIGGEQISYHDIEYTNQGSAYRQNEGVDIEALTDNGNVDYAVAYTVAGEWLSYTIQVAKTANYFLTFRVASTSNGSSIGLDVDGDSLLSKVSIPKTNGFAYWKDVNIKNIPLTAGTHTMRLNIKTGGCSINYIDFNEKDPTVFAELIGLHYFDISPNPCTNFVTLRYDTNEEYTISVTNILGEKIINSLPLHTNTENEINETLSQQNAGLYIFSISKNGSFLESKIVLKQ